MIESPSSSKQSSTNGHLPAWQRQSDTQQSTEQVEQAAEGAAGGANQDSVTQAHHPLSERPAAMSGAGNDSPATTSDASSSSDAAAEALSNGARELAGINMQQPSSYAVGSSSNNGNADNSSYASPSAPASASASPSKSGATVLMASRKQNSACDACRSRKVRCNRDPGEAKCNHCKAKNIDCTTLYVQWATSSAKRPTKRPRTSLPFPPEEKKEAPKPPEVIDAAVQVQDRLLNALFQRDTDYAPTDNQVYFYQNLPCNAPLSAGGYTTRNLVPSSYLPGPKPAATTGAELHLLDRQRREDFVNDLVETYFSVVHARLPLLNPQTFRKRYYERSPELGGPPSDIILALVIAWGAKFSENPLIAQDRDDSAQELRKAWNQAQTAIARGETEKANQITGFKGGVEQPILTVPEELREQGRNRIADHLTWRAQDVMDRLRVARVATLENAQACFLMEPLLLHPSVYFNGNINIAGDPVPAKHRSLLAYTNGHWYVIAIKHMLDLGIHCKEKVMTIKDPGLRGETLFTWWLACMADSASALFFQRRCLISGDDYNSDPPAGDADNKNEAPHPLGSIDSYLAFFGSAHDAVVFQRKLAALYFAPRSHIEGVALHKVAEIVESLKKWRDDHLEKVGVPLPHWPPHWDYIAAVSACTSDINYHANWIVLWRLVDEMGIYGTDRSDATSPIHQDRLKRRLDPDQDVPRDGVPDAEQVQLILNTIQEEALNSALRIAGLTEILRSNSYLRLDPCNSLQSLEQAAHLLIRFQRTEVDIIVAGFRQYGLSYEDCFDKADIMEDLAAAYNERARQDASFVPGSALGLALERDAAGVGSNGIPGLAIAAAALSNAAASANDAEAGFAFEQQQAGSSADVKDVNETNFDSMFAATGDDQNTGSGGFAEDATEATA
ncbi:Zn(2)-C6 fungal-type domain-containing protein [Pseudozyma hubeiensis]|nr:Zn(2)-C6 fungal-type domain-containing protein [Pseudozyma hubeiensis]